MFSLYFGKLSDKIGRKKVLFFSFIFWLIVCSLFILGKNYLVLLAGFIFYGLHKAALEPVQKAYVAELSPKEYLASSLGGFQMIVGLAALPGSFIAGLLWDRLGMSLPFYFSLILTLITISLLKFIKEEAFEKV